MDGANRSLRRWRALRHRNERNGCPPADLSRLHRHALQRNQLQPHSCPPAAAHPLRGYVRTWAKQCRLSRAVPQRRYGFLQLQFFAGRCHGHLAHQRPAPCHATYLQRTCRPPCNRARQPQPRRCCVFRSPHREALVQGKDSIRIQSARIAESRNHSRRWPGRVPRPSARGGVDLPDSQTPGLSLYFSGARTEPFAPIRFHDATPTRDFQLPQLEPKRAALFCDWRHVWQRPVEARRFIQEQRLDQTPRGDDAAPTIFSPNTTLQFPKCTASTKLRQIPAARMRSNISAGSGKRSTDEGK